MIAVPAVALGGAPAFASVLETPQNTAWFNGPVRAIVYDGTTMYVGGDFTRAKDDSGGVRRNHVAAIDVRSGQLLRWRPNVNRSVRSLAVVGDRVYLGGSFTSVNGARRERIAAVGKAGRGQVVRTFRHRVNAPVNALASRHGRVYAGGSFTKVDGARRAALAAFSVRTGKLDARWHPSADNSVATLAVDRKRVYVGGYFLTLNGHAAHGYLGAVGVSAGRIDTTFDPKVTYPFLDLALTRRALYAAGDGPGGHLHKFSKRGAERWVVSTNGAVQAVKVLDGTVYAGGHFSEVCTTPRNLADGGCRDEGVKRRKMFSVSGASNLQPWSPDADSFTGVRAVAVHQGRNLVAMGGDFTQLGGPTGWYDRRYIAQFK